MAVPLWRQIFSYRYLLNSVYLQSKAKKMSSFECAQLAGTVTLPYKVSPSGNESIPSATHTCKPQQHLLILAIVFMFYYLSPEKVAEDVKITVSPCVIHLYFVVCTCIPEYSLIPEIGLERGNLQNLSRSQAHRSEERNVVAVWARLLLCCLRFRRVAQMSSSRILWSRL